MAQTIIPLPESDEHTLCIEMKGVITLEDFRVYFERPLREIIGRQGIYSIFAVYSDNDMKWNEDAADFSFRFYTEIGHYRRKVAFVNAPDSRLLLAKMLQPVIDNGEIRFFDMEQREEALAWVKQSA
ncbi:MAG: hypothetical protein JWO78_2347 [Micavibrio sp.]|nr:hypothetical protein [Micavibrio sp.]